MGRLSFTGHEWGTSAEAFSAAGTFSFVTSPVNPGGSVRALKVNPTGTGVGYLSLGAPSATGALGYHAATATVWDSFYFQWAVKPTTGDEEFFAPFSNNGTRKLGVRLNSDGKIVAYDRNGTLLATGTTVLSQDTWYLIQVKTGTGASAAYEIKIGDTSELSGTGDLYVGNNGSPVFGKVSNFNGNSVEFYYDDAWRDDAAYKGAQVTVALHPNANGSTQQWTAGTGASDWNEVKEVVPDPTTYVQSIAQNDVALFDLEASSVPGISGTIHGVLALNRTRENAAGTSAGALRLRSNVTNSDTSNYDHGASIITIGKYVDVDPDTAAAWTTGGLDAVEVGSVDNGTNVLRLYTATLMVSFTAAGGTQFTQATADSAQFTELLGRQVGKAVAEAVGLTETQTRQLQRTLSESLSLTEALSRLVQRRFSESLSLTEDPLGRAVVKLKDLGGETVVLTEAQTRQLRRTMAEGLGLTEALTKIMQRAPFSETLSLTEASLGRQLVKLQDLGGETLGLTEALTRAALKTLGETVALTEAVARDVRRALAETLGLSESVTRRVARALAETLSLSEGLTPLHQPGGAPTVGDVIRVLSEVFAMAGGSSEAFAMAGGSSEAFVG